MIARAGLALMLTACLIATTATLAARALHGLAGLL